MRTLVTVTIATAFLFAAETSRAADDPAAVVDKAIKAVGGEEKIARNKAEQWKAKGSMEMMGQKMTYTADYFFQRPGQMRFDVAVSIGDMKVNFSAATDGKIAWQKSGDQLEDMPAKKAKAFHHQVHSMQICQLAPLKGKDYTLAMADEIKVDGNDAVGIKVSKKDHADVTMYFDKKTGLLAKTTTTIWDEFSDKDVSQEVLFKDYKERGGVKGFDKIIINRDGKPFIVEEFTDQKTLEKLDPKLFAKP